MKKIKVVLDEWDNTCGDGCCYTYGTTVTVNNTEMPLQNQDAGTILEQVLTHLGYDVEVINTYNGK